MTARWPESEWGAFRTDEVILDGRVSLNAEDWMFPGMPHLRDDYGMFCPEHGPTS